MDTTYNINKNLSQILKMWFENSSKGWTCVINLEEKDGETVFSMYIHIDAIYLKLYLLFTSWQDIVSFFQGLQSSSADGELIKHYGDKRHGKGWLEYRTLEQCQMDNSEWEKEAIKALCSLPFEAILSDLPAWWHIALASPAKVLSEVAE